MQITDNVSASFCVSAEPSGVFPQRLRQFLWRRLWGEGGSSVPLSFRWGRVLEDQSDGSAGQCGLNIVWWPRQVYFMCCRVRLWRCPAVGKSYFRFYFTGLRYCCFKLKSKLQMFVVSFKNKCVGKKLTKINKSLWINCKCSWTRRAHWRVVFVSQVFMLDTQCSPKTPNNKEGFEHAQSCVLIIELPSDQQSNGHTQKR